MRKVIIAIFVMFSFSEAIELNTQMQGYVKSLETEAKTKNPNFQGFDYARGEAIFIKEEIGKNGTLISCVSCHTNDLNQNGKNEHTNKVIKPLSPSVNPERFTSVKEVKKWLRRNFKDVYNREGTAEEKGDVITYIINKK